MLVSDNKEDLGRGLVPLPHQQQPKATVIFHALGAAESTNSNTLCKLKAAVTGVSAVRVSTMTTVGGRRERGVDKVVVSACAKDLSTIVVDCSHSRSYSHAQRFDRIDFTSVVRSNFVAHAGMIVGGEGGIETSLAQQMVNRVGSSLPLFLGNVVAAPFLTVAGGGGGGGGGVTSSSCRLSVDGEHVLVSAVKDHECSLYRYHTKNNRKNTTVLPYSSLTSPFSFTFSNLSYLLQPRGSATLEGHNVVSYDNDGLGIGIGQRKPKPLSTAAATPCVALGRGLVIHDDFFFVPSFLPFFLPWYYHFFFNSFILCGFSQQDATPCLWCTQRYCDTPISRSMQSWHATTTTATAITDIATGYRPSNQPRPPPRDRAVYRGNFPCDCRQLAAQTQ